MYLNLDVSKVTTKVHSLDSIQGPNTRKGLLSPLVSYITPYKEKQQRCSLSIVIGSIWPGVEKIKSSQAAL